MIQEVLFTGSVARFLRVDPLYIYGCGRRRRSTRHKSSNNGVTAIARFLRRMDPDELLVDLKIDTTNSTALYTVDSCQ